MTSREGSMKSEKFARELSSIYPIIEADGSDSAAYDNVLELLMVNGVVSLPEAVMMVSFRCVLICR
jgi:glutamate synthase (NADPH/NADH)